MPNHVEVDVLRIDAEQTHEYDNWLVDQVAFTGYGCENKFCEWLFTKCNSNPTVIAHNGAGYDFKFILKWCLHHGLTPDSYIRQGSHIMYMAFRKFSLRFVDSCKFFLEPLRKLPKTYGIDTIKGHFPHRFNRPENQEYIGCIPCTDAFDAMNFKEEE